MTPQPTYVTAGLGGFSNAKALFGTIVAKASRLEVIASMLVYSLQG